MITPLSFFNLSRRGQFSAREQQTHTTVARLRKLARQAQKRNVSMKTRLRHAEMLVRDGSWIFLSNMPETRRNFLISHFRNVNRDKFHRHFTLRDKMFALALCKRSANAYRFMKGIFTLPSIETLRKLSAKIPVQPGFCPFLFDSISAKVARSRDEKSRYCVLLFDETSLDPSLQYNVHSGSVEGFVDTGYERKPKIANHAMVWMLKGVRGDWTQPILYSFCHSTAKWEDIVRTFKDIVRECLRCNLHIVSSICDQGATNARKLHENRVCRRNVTKSIE